MGSCLIIFFKNMFKEKNWDNKEADAVDWESLDKWKIIEKIFKYFNDAERNKLNLTEDKKIGDSGYFRRYVDEKGRVIREERHYENSSDEDYESSSTFFEKEYSYTKDGAIESLVYRTSGNFDYDSILSSYECVGKAMLEYEGGKIKKVKTKEVRSDYSEWSDEKDYEGGRDIEFFIEYDENGDVLSISKEKKEFNSSQTEKDVIYEKNRDKEKIFNKMSALEIIEHNLTKFN